MRRCYRWVLTVFTVVGLILVSQGIVWALPAPQPHLVDGLFMGASAVEAADIDGDGQMDIIGAGYYSDSITWWRNLGNHQWLPATVDNLYGAFAIAIADIDSDGDTDIVGLSRPGNSVWWYENVPGFGVGARVFLRHFVMSRPGEIGHAVTAGDFDNDGTIDIGAAFRMDPVVYVARNLGGTGSGLASNIVGLPVVGNGVSFVKAEDMDGDGDQDLLAATPWDWVGNLNYFWFRNDGGGLFGPQTKIAGGLPLNGAFGARHGDVDGDGLKDIVILSEQNPSSLTPPLYPLYPSIQWVRRLNIQGTRWAKPSRIDNLGFGSDGPGGLDLADIDLDGDLDVVSGSALQSARSSIWLNHLQGQRWRRYDIEFGFGLHGVRAVDLTGDGKPEILAASWGGCCYTGEIKYWQFY